MHRLSIGMVRGAIVAGAGTWAFVSSASGAMFEFMGTTPNPAGGFVNPAMLVGFNPQPDPPGSFSAYDDRDPQRLLFHTSSMRPDFSILIGLNLPAVQGQFFGYEGMMPNVDGVMQFGWMGGRAFDFTVMFHLMTSSPLDRTSWISLNPQPEVPSFPGAVQFNFSMTPVARGESPPEGDRYFATLAVEIWNGDERIPWEFVPAPGAAGLLACAGLMTARRRRRDP